VKFFKFLMRKIEKNKENAKKTKKRFENRLKKSGNL